MTTLLALLLASPVYTETWVCANQTSDGNVYQGTYTRSGDHFVHQEEIFDRIKRGQADGEAIRPQLAGVDH
jgi:hypothetical protein